MEHRFRHLLVIQMLLTLAAASAGTFGIVYLAKEGIAPGRGFSMAEAPLFYLAGFFFSSLFSAVMAWRPSVRARTSMALGLLTLGMAYAGMAVLRGYILVTVISFFYGVSLPLFYLPFNALIVKRTRAENRGMRMGVLFLAVTVIGVIAPTIAGQIISAASYAVLFAFGFVCLLLDAVIVFVVIGKEHELVFRLKFASFGRRNVAAMFFEGCSEGLTFSLIPLITFLFVKGEQELGYIFSVFALAGGAMTLILGFMSDRIRRRHLFMWAGAVMSSVFALMVSLAPDLGSFVAGNSMLQLTSSVAPLFIFAMMADIGEDDPASVSATREVLLNAGRAFSLSIYLVMAVAGVGIQMGFIAASIYLLLMLIGKGSGRADKK